MKHRLEIHPDHRFSCTQCGHCCRHHVISFTDEERRALEARDWPSLLPDLAGRTLWEPVPGARGAMTWRFRLREDGSCPFLGERNQCRIHERFGADAKPLTCRLYPYTFAETPAGAFVGLRFDCPGVVRGDGATLASASRELVALHEAVHRVAAPPAYPETVRVGARGVLDWADVRRVDQTADRLLADAELPFPVRLLAVLRVAEMLESARMETLTCERLASLLEMVVPTLRDEERAAGLVRPALNGGERVLFRQLLGLVYAQEYSRFASLPLGARLRLRLRAAANGYRFLFLRGTVAMRDWPAPVDLARVSAVGGPVPSPETTALWERWLRGKLWAKATFSRLGFELPYLSGLGFLGVAFAGAAWFARASAAARGATLADRDDLVRGLRYSEHAFTGARGLGPYHRMVIGALSRPAIAARLVRHFGDPTAPAP